ncbi:cysteine hydrolase [Paraburkholderia atlantica]|uniref:cysteine hydrolase n=1 Tax=Paraburkholderia atlantica TaxID=2654982 RepID=UPI0018034754|nr:cysteine hydrolase [Paraburkholderia atlantica]MBB5504846.1 isochorismate hydrolase [Paraburkholderia atlantica]
MSSSKLAHQVSPYADPADPALPKTGFGLDRSKAALVVIDPQNDFLSPGGASWPFFGQSITENNTVEHIGQLFKAAKELGLVVYGPETNDLVLQLRKQGVSQILLAGMAANLCIESHLRELIERAAQVFDCAGDRAHARLPERPDKLAKHPGRMSAEASRGGKTACVVLSGTSTRLGRFH